jgi:hypothetical protein
MPAEREHPACPACGMPIGVYEPLWRVHPWLGARRTSWLLLADAPRLPLESLWHAECAEAAGIDGG